MITLTLRRNLYLHYAYEEKGSQKCIISFEPWVWLVFIKEKF